MEFIQTGAAVKFFFIGFGCALGVVVFFIGVVGWFVSRKIDKYDNYQKRIESLERFRAGIITAHKINTGQDITCGTD